MHLDDTFDERQPDAGALGHAVQFVEQPEDAVMMSGFDADAIVTDCKMPIVFGRRAGYFNGRLDIGLLKLDSDSNQVLKELYDFESVSNDYTGDVV